MQAVRLARYHTKRTHIVRFCGAYHGWWGEVQPGPGNPSVEERTYTLRDMHERSLRVLRSRNDIACVLVNPLQAMHPNKAAPGDSSLMGSRQGHGVDREAYARWLRSLRTICSERGIPLILDEVFTGFRLARGGAQSYFDVQADLVTYGKTVGGGLPIGVVCGRSSLMRRFREKYPGDLCFARGTFNSHPVVMGAMACFLDALDSPEVAALYQNLDELWEDRATTLNRLLEAADLPVRVAALGTVWTVIFERPSRYNWMFQYYLREAGLALSWVGTGRFIFSLDFTEKDFRDFVEAVLAAARAMVDDGWCWVSADASNRAIALQLLREVVGLGRVPS
jgi:glutamate-1-semialdehyde 2,1-aminomutase